MQNIGPFVIRLPNSENPSQLHWCYLTFDGDDKPGMNVAEDNKYWSMKTVPVSDDEPAPDWDSSTLIASPLPLLSKIHVVAHPQSNSLSWTPYCFVIQRDTIDAYGFADYSKIIIQFKNQYKMSQEKYGQGVFGPDKYDITPLDLNVPIEIKSQHDAITTKYAQWFSSKITALSPEIRALADKLDVSESELQDEDVLIEYLLSLTTLRTLLSDKKALGYILYAQLHFSGAQNTLENALNDVVAARLNKLSYSFDKIVNALLTNGWSPKPLNYYAQLIASLPAEKQLVLINKPAVQAQIAALIVEQAFSLEPFLSCDTKMRSVLLTIPDVKAALQKTIDSAIKLNAFKWRDDYKAKNEIVQAIGLDTVKSWIVDRDSLNAVWRSTTSALFSELIWDNIPLLAKQGVRSDWDASHALTALFASRESKNDINQKITLFFESLSEACVTSHFSIRVYQGIFTNPAITPEQKEHLFSLPRVSSAISSSDFISMLNGRNGRDVVALKDVNAICNAFYPEKMKAFILLQGREIIPLIPHAQKNRIQVLCTNEDLKYKPDLFNMKARDQARIDLVAQSLAIATGTKPTPQPVLAGTGNLNDAKLSMIQQAVKTTRTQYEAWYLNQTSYRGNNGWLTWFRHGSTGQTKALALQTAVDQIQTDEDVIQAINIFLSADATRYNRHSFASFLLDELKKIEDTPWANLEPDSENIYSKLSH